MDVGGRATQEQLPRMPGINAAPHALPARVGLKWLYYCAIPCSAIKASLHIPVQAFVAPIPPLTLAISP